MDKNMISIDDLVRQRLSGGEEQERAGSWMQMRELLDKEMPEVRPGGLFSWRRTLSALSMLLLIGTAGLGSYKIYSAGTGNSVAAADKHVATPRITATTVSGNLTDKENQIVYNKISNRETVHNQSENTAAAIAPMVIKQLDHSLAGKNTNVNSNDALPGKAGSGHIDHKNDGVAQVAKVTHQKKGITSNQEILAMNMPKEEASAPVEITSTAAKNGENSGKASVAEQNNKTIKNKKVASAAIKGINKNKEQGINKEIVGKKGSSALPVADMATGKTALAANAMASARADKKKENGHKPSTPPKSALLLGGSMGTGTTAYTPSATKQSHKNSLARAAVAGQGMANVNNATIKALAGTTAANTSLGSKNAAHINKIGTVTKNNNGVPDKNVPGNSEETHAVAVKTKVKPVMSEEMKKVSLVNMKKGKKVIEKMEIYQHLIKNSPLSASSGSHYQLDTISIETFTEDIASGDDKITMIAKRYARMIPNSQAPNAALPVAKTTEEAKAKRKGGITMIEHLQSAFNDIKYNVASVQFAPGITGGINGTFFGPNSFKGFQFGLTGDFVFNDKWSMMAELKYVHRINNNYTMNDNYNIYNYVPGMHAYEKDSFSHSYSFSTLHSFELPVCVKYANGDFTFFAGGNFAYTLGVNPSENPQIAPIPPTYVTTPGANSIAKFTPNDLQTARFGIGYLFGFGYKIAPNMVLDLRNVQTIWDNAANSGSRIISSQLYKSPSFQFSLTYRFGDKKEKEDKLN